MRCECGCGIEGEDPVTQYLVEEAVLTAYDLHEAAAHELAEEQAERAVARARSLTRRERVLQRTPARSA